MPTLPREAQPSTEESPQAVDLLSSAELAFRSHRNAPGLPADGAILLVRGASPAKPTNALGTRLTEARSPQAERPR
jgi:hypothetical protein